MNKPDPNPIRMPETGSATLGFFLQGFFLSGTIPLPGGTVDVVCTAKPVFLYNKNWFQFVGVVCKRWGIILFRGKDRKSVSNPPSWIFQVEIYNKQVKKHKLS